MIVVHDAAEKSVAKSQEKSNAKNIGLAKTAQLKNLVRGTSKAQSSRTVFNLHVTGTPGGMHVKISKRDNPSESAFSTWHMYQEYRPIILSVLFLQCSRWPRCRSSFVTQVPGMTTARSNRRLSSGAILVLQCGHCSSGSKPALGMEDGISKGDSTFKRLDPRAM